MRESIFFLLFCSSLFASPEIFYKARSGNLQEAFNLYKNSEQKDFTVIQDIAKMIIEQGWASRDPEIQLLSVYGAGVSRDAKLLPILESGINSSVPQIQLASLYFLSEQCDDQADRLIKRAMASDYLIIRYEAAKVLATKKDLNAIPQVEGLMCKIDPALMPLFPPFFALSSDHHSTLMLKKFFSDRDARVRLAAILGCLECKRDDMLPHIRMLASHGSIEEQEAALFTLGVLKDSSAEPLLMRAKNSQREQIRLAALLSLYNLGHTEVQTEIEEMAQKGNCFALYALGSIAGSEDFLAKIQEGRNQLMRINATLALLQRKDPRCVPHLTAILTQDARDFVVMEHPSPGMVLTSWKASFLVGEKKEGQLEMVTAMREELLQQAVQLPKEAFYMLARQILNAKTSELVPALVGYIEQEPSEEAATFLKTELQRAGAPTVRAFCNLALFRMREEGPWVEYVRASAKKMKHLEMISFRPISSKAKGPTTYSMTPKEECRLFIEVLEALANQKDEGAIEALFHSMCHGNPKNRYALAGLLIRATE